MSLARSVPSSQSIRQVVALETPGQVLLAEPQDLLGAGVGETIVPFRSSTMRPAVIASTRAA